MSSYLGTVQSAASRVLFAVPLTCIWSFTDYVQLLCEEAQFPLVAATHDVGHEAWVGRVTRPFIPDGTGQIVHADSTVLVRSSCGEYLIAFKPLDDRSYECSLYADDPAVTLALLDTLTAQALPSRPRTSMVG